MKFTTIHPHQRKRFFERKGSSVYSAFLLRWAKRIKESQLRKFNRQESRPSPLREIICMSESRLPCGCSRLLLFMSQTDQRQHSLTLCLLLFFKRPYMCSYSLHVKHTLINHFRTTNTWKLASLITWRYSCRNVQSSQHYTAQNIQVKRSIYYILYLVL